MSFFCCLCRCNRSTKEPAPIVEHLPGEDPRSPRPIVNRDAIKLADTILKSAESRNTKSKQVIHITVTAHPVPLDVTVKRDEISSSESRYYVSNIADTK